MDVDLEPAYRSRQPDKNPVVVIGGGQSGLAAAGALHELGVSALVLEAGDRPAGSWPQYYDSLRLFSPAGFSSMPGMRFPGDPDHYPAGDEVADYLDRYAAQIPVEIQTRTRVVSDRKEDHVFEIGTSDVRRLGVAGIVAASGSFSNPYAPVFPGQERFTGQLMHVAEYRNPGSFAGLRVIVVGAGDSAAQIANELAPVADVTVAARHPLRFIPQRIGGHDVHYWLRELGTLDPTGTPLHAGGVSTTDVGLVYVGLEYQRSFASNTLRGVSADAAAVAAPLAAWIRDAPGAVGASSSETAPLAFVE